jgi:segregation and condensation protein B
MSLKAKLEAVIYAAEEPVTLNQLAAIFAADALEWKSEQEAARAEAAAEEAGESLLGEDFGEVFGVEEEAVSTPDNSGDKAQETFGDLGLAGSDEKQPDEVEAGTTEAADAAMVLSAPGAADEESELKRQARLIDREVKSILRKMLDEIIASYESDEKGVEVREIAGGFRMATKPECHDAVRLFVKSLKPALKLSLAALETLAVIAYKQPVTSPEVSEIRGVESAGVLGSLLARKLIATAGRKQVIGRPILYKTTKEFLLRFGLKDIAELPSMEEFEKMAAIELEEPELNQEPEPKADDAEELTAEAAEKLESDQDLLDQSTDSAEELVENGERLPMKEEDPGAM